MDVVGLGIARLAAQKDLGSASASTFMSRMTLGSENNVILVHGDSTGVVGDTPWPLAIAQKLASMFPAYTVNYRVWDDTSQAYKALGSASTYPATNAPKTSSYVVQTGTGTGNAGGPFVLDVYNGSMPGGQAGYPKATLARWTAMHPATPNLVFVNYGHNSNGATTGYRPTHYALTRTIQESFPQAGIVQLAQNPRSSNAGSDTIVNDLIRARVVMDLSRTEGYGLINVAQSWLSNSSYGSDWTLSDGLYVHPNDAGSLQIANLVMKHMSASIGIPPQAPKSGQTQVWIPASSFSLYAGTPTLGLVNNENQMWSMANGVDSEVIASISYPSHWGGFDYYVLWTNSVASGGGSIALLTYYQNQGLGLSDVQLTTGVNAAGNWVQMQGSPSIVPNRNYQTWCTNFVQMGPQAITTTKPIGFRVKRVGTNGSDTFASPAYFMGVLLVRSS